MGKKRGNGEGTIVKKKNGKFGGAVTLGHDASGKQVRRYFTAGTHAEAQEMLRKLSAERDRGASIEAHKLMVSAYLSQWLEHKERDIQPKTLEEYSHMVERQLKPRLGRLLLTKLNALDVERMVSGILNDGYSPHKARAALKVLKVALTQAVHWNLLPLSPAAKVKPPKLPPKDMKVWTPREAGRFLEAVKHHRLYALFYLALATGMRRGELLGLHWDMVDLDNAVLHVRRNLYVVGNRMTLGEPKTKASRRTITLSPDTVQVLRDHRINVMLELGRDSKLVFPSTVNTYLSGNNVLRAFASLTKQADVPKMRFHGLRHTAASLLIRNGVNVKVVADRLGHANPGITLNIYTHLYEEQRRQGAMPLIEMLG